MKKNVLVLNMVDEYPLPCTCDLILTEVFDPYLWNETLPEYLKDTLNEQQAQVRLIKHQFEPRSTWTISPVIYEDSGAVTSIMGNWTGIEDEIAIKYLKQFEGYLKDLWRDRGADDDYFDYLPSITDVFYQLSKAWEEWEHWDRFIEWLVKQEGGVLEDSLYRYNH